MPRTAEQLHADALAIWQAGVSAVRSDRLVRKALRVEGSALVLAGETLELASIGRIVVVGAGKAGGEWRLPWRRSSGGGCWRRRE